MSTTPRWGLPELAEAQASKEARITAGNRLLDALVQPIVISMTEVDPPVSPSDGDMYVVGEAPDSESEWNGHSYEIAYYQATGWVYIVPKVGMRVYDLETTSDYRYTGDSETPWEVIA